ncbi:MAG: hypothetical protein QOH62_3275 [Solirubrobacteraceae bacterium]|nr:hypothetical protein [Solirubrobacteraceae bacterium]
MTWRVPLALAFGLVVAAPAGGQAPPETNPCKLYRTAKCPDLIMAPPSNLYVGRSPKGHLRLYASNRIINVGAGPLELKGTRSGAREMVARQVLYRRGNRPIVIPDAGEIYFKFVDSGRGSYWKYSHAASFELWTLDPQGTRVRLRRTGPKLDYCFRDLQRVRSYARTPRRQIYPACSQARGLASDRLGVSPGWADIYPSTYPENWIDITGLKGCFAFVHRADPLGKIAEESDGNNVGVRHIRLPPVHGSVAPRGCP